MTKQQETVKQYFAALVGKAPTWTNKGKTQVSFKWGWQARAMFSRKKETFPVRDFRTAAKKMGLKVETGDVGCSCCDGRRFVKIAVPNTFGGVR